MDVQLISWWGEHGLDGVKDWPEPEERTDDQETVSKAD